MESMNSLKSCDVTRFTVNTPKNSIKYKSRCGSYGILKDDRGRYGVIKTSTGYFLIGGGKESDESYRECLKREALEEAGIELEIERKLSIGEYYFYSTTMDIHMLSIGHFYICNSNGKVCEPIEEDHSLVWLEYEDVIEKLYLKNQREAIKRLKKPLLS